MDYKSAAAIAVSVGNRLLPHCDKLNIAGSIRRKKAEVKDVEMVVSAKRWTVPSIVLFNNEPDHTEPIPAFVQMANSLGRIIKGNPHGRYMQIELPEGIVLDLFMPEVSDFYRQLAIRTGSSDYSARVIAGGWKAKGWCGSDKGLRKISDCQQRISGGKVTWLCINPDAEKPPEWESEADFFTWLDVEWIKPELRF